MMACLPTGTSLAFALEAGETQASTACRTKIQFAYSKY
jgi:hypothetical protein